MDPAKNPDRHGKRLLDVAGALLILLLGAPFLALAALAILVTMGRPILYRQTRTGLGGRLFLLVKLRTMVANTLHALAINAGLSLRAQLLTKGGRKQLAGLQLSAIGQQQRRS